ncbi:hypothetical protein [Pseudarthrobacter sp. NamE2]|uniref:hypothetical protein n=1 Tax=Pseudarthrobacter sp. NamE2 TaxID=2576838 RepID=UPI00197A9147|nr:hypothetical protein [Pseudarthrobacter sp. NamE2]
MENTRSGWTGSSAAWLLGPLATGLGWAAHVAGGGQSPAVLIVLALAALLGMVASMLGRRRLPGWAVLVAAAVAQQLLHLAFSAFSSPSGFSLPGHGHGETPAPDTTPAQGATAPSHDLHVLLYLHAAAALLTVLAAAQWPRILQWRLPARQDHVEGRLSGSQRAADDADA